MRRKVRTFLTIGGIAIGIAALTLIVALVTSARDYINAQADAFLAPNTVLVVSEQRGLLAYQSVNRLKRWTKISQA